LFCDKIAVYGKNFCWSAKEAFKLLMRNILRVAVVDKVTDFILFVGKLLTGLFCKQFPSFGLATSAHNLQAVLSSAVFVRLGNSEES